MIPTKSPIQLDNKMKKLEELFKMVEDDKLTHKEFKVIFEQSLKDIKDYIDNRYEPLLKKTLSGLDAQAAQAISKIIGDESMVLSRQIETELESCKEHLKNLVNTNKITNKQDLIEFANKYNTKLDELKKLISKVNLAELEDKLRSSIEEVKKQIPTIPPQLSAIEIGRKVDSLEGESRVDKSSIKGIEEIEKAIEELKKRKGITLFGGGGGSSSGGKVVKIYDISSQLDGSTKTFVIPSNWRVLTVHASSFPFSAFRPNVDFTYTSSSITFTSEITEAVTLASGQSVLVEYAES